MNNEKPPVEDKLQVIEVKQFRGMNVVDDPITLDPSESPMMTNLDITKNGALTCRYGYEEVIDLTSAGGSGRMHGLGAYYNTNGTYNGDYLISFNNDKLFRTQGVNYAGTISVGSTYSGGNRKVRGITHLNNFVYGNNAFTPLFFDGNSITPVATGIAADVLGVFQSRLFISGRASTLYWSKEGTMDTDINTNFTDVALGDGTVISGIIPNLDFLQVYKQNSIHGVSWSVNSDGTISIPQLQVIQSYQGGNIAISSLQAVYGYTYFLSKYGFQAYGASPERVTANIPLPLSLVLDPLIQQINFDYSDQVASAFFDNKYLCAVPIGRSQSINNVVLVFNENIKRRFGIDNWVQYTGLPVDDFAVYRNGGQDELYFSSAYEPKVYKFNKSYSDNGSGYERLWRSKTFQNGERTEWVYMDLEGAKTVESIIYVDLWTDGIKYPNIQITDANFILSSTGSGYLGDNYTGTAYLGDAYESPSAMPLYRFRKRIRFPQVVNMGYNMYFTIRNNANNEGWKLNRYRIIYRLQPDDPNFPYTD